MNQKPNKEDVCPENQHLWYRVWKASNNYQLTYYCRKCWEERREIKNHKKPISSR